MRFKLQNNLLVPEHLLKKGSLNLQKISNIELPPPVPLNSKFPYSIKLQSCLTGRSLLLDELPFELKMIHDHYTNGYITYQKGIENHQCKRCGNTKKHLFASFQCFRCKEPCIYCRNCIMMGRVSECTPLLTWAGPSPAADAQTVFNWHGTLSQAQQEASDRVVEAVRKKDDLLVWAVCGAGKTEILFEGIYEALEQNKRVCIAAPRTDVILELSPRLQRVFQQTSITSLYGGSEDRHHYGRLVLSTTHQLYRYENIFDLMIIDEVDAFPYSYDSSLQFAVNKARKTESTVVRLTATPDSRTQKLCSSGKQHHIRIPARYHRHPIPAPRFEWCGNWKKALEKNRIPSRLKKWTSQRLHQNKQALIFFPSVQAMDKALPLFQEVNPVIESVHAEDPCRKEKVQKLRDNETQILLTTTILERGVTIPDIDVAVLGAEEQIFTESALVQIAGRAGRSADYPKGDVVYFHYGRTREMIHALLHIFMMNREARKRGLIDE
ncbi:DEAD/DEAH box helicase [Bacillus haikouensis]|uniref:DEAD/DEAH box helicase n=1 Tax=Bacillus haikouensis TaxID=1510468 RepID=UPI001557EF08|nr:DEAD/DEAH box helicase [Bacillus haikouensis]NQD65103.1 DEAD/DEAH box helicase [Bacillus haikouensis]